MSVYKKLQEARIKLSLVEMKKSGHNTYAGYHYFELGDFLIPIQKIFHEVGLCGVVKFSAEEATLVIVDIDDPLQRIEFTSPMGSANLKGCHAVQNIGAVETYQRRYLYICAMEIVENDAIDGQPHHEEKKTVIKKPLPEKELSEENFDAALCAIADVDSLEELTILVNTYGHACSDSQLKVIRQAASNKKGKL